MFVTRKGAGIASEGRDASYSYRQSLPCFATLSFAGVPSGPHPGFASLSMAVPGQSRMKVEAGNVVQEAATGLEFTREYCTRGKTSNCSKVAGLGVRAKRILGMKNINGRECIANLGSCIASIYIVGMRACLYE